MPNRSIKDERQNAPRPKEKPRPAPDPATKDLSALGTARKLRSRKQVLEDAIDAGS